MSFQYYLELLGTFVFAISGALAITGKDKDWVGATFTGFITAIGGGTLRDILLDRHPLVWISDMAVVYTIVAGIVCVYFFSKTLGRLSKTLLLFDTLGISLFTIVGTEVALHHGVRGEIAVVMGMFSAVMGGVIRDTLTQETPVILQRGVYASACFIGAAIYLILRYFDLDRNLNFIISISSIIIIRLLSVRYEWAVPGFDRKFMRKEVD
ncbi:trimeric intracellular cation channel family protein [Owenweeksia hongkongensis]|uniref:trimeric intracellular cation channel family protein n=1 Tax=Owenweeksia hongkongensis TaxID=253245 RepID=UPI003A8E23AA